MISFWNKLGSSKNAEVEDVLFEVFVRLVFFFPVGA